MADLCHGAVRYCVKSKDGLDTVRDPSTAAAAKHILPFTPGSPQQAQDYCSASSCPCMKFSDDGDL